MKIVMRKIGKTADLESVPVPDAFDFVFGEGFDRVTVAVRDGKVEVRAVEGQLVIHPRACNWISVETKWS